MLLIKQSRTLCKVTIPSQNSEVDCNNCFKKYTGETGRKLKERMKEHKDVGEKVRKDEKRNAHSQHIKTTDHSPAWNNVSIIYKENNWKKRST